MPDPIRNVLFPCTGNSAQPGPAEPMLCKAPSPLRTLENPDHPADGLGATSWRGFAVADARSTPGTR